uniref:Putative secreted protein n=1 Tax=Anopheles marajoara TaxID=58244 RepID=A0A2M4C7K6_9DIPT
MMLRSPACKTVAPAAPGLLAPSASTSETHVLSRSIYRKPSWAASRRSRSRTGTPAAPSIGIDGCRWKMLFCALSVLGKTCTHYPWCGYRVNTNLENVSQFRRKKFIVLFTFWRSVG